MNFNQTDFKMEEMIYFSSPPPPKQKIKKIKIHFVDKVQYEIKKDIFDLFYLKTSLKYCKYVNKKYGLNLPPFLPIWLKGNFRTVLGVQ